MLRVGITGGIGSGKSTVSRVLATLGVPVYDTDSRAKALMNGDPALRQSITALLGAGAYRDGQLDRAYVASRVFTDRGLIGSLNSIVHPAVGSDFERWAREREASGAAYVVLESAILFESGFDRYVERTITVSAPVEERVARAVARDGAEEKTVRQRMANQMDNAERERRSDFVIHNAESDLLLPQVLELDRLFRDANR